MRCVRSTVLLLLLAWPVFLRAQEVRYIDISSVRQRTELRYPPAPDCNAGLCGSSGGASVADGAPDQRDPHALGVYLLGVTPIEIDPAEPFEAEFKVLNTGTASIQIPVSPHLSDLQPPDESEAFSYFSLTLLVNGQSEPEGKGSNVPAQGYIELFGSHEHEGTLIDLRPGEWIRVRATMKLHTWPLEPTPARLRGGFWLRKNVVRPQAGGGFTEIRNLYPNATATPSVPVYLLGSASSQQSKQ